MRGAWSVAEGPQSDYEALRAEELDGRGFPCLARLRFERGGLAGLILCPVTEPRLSAVLVGARRPAWSPYEDPRVAVVAEVYGLLLEATGDERRSWSEVR